MIYDAGSFDIAVIGAGHAGIEAALAAARLARLLADHCRTDPSTPVSRLIAALPEVLPRSRDEILALGRA